MISMAYTAAAALAAILIGMAWMVVWSRRDLWWLRGTSLILAVFSSLASLACLFTFLGYATPFLPGYTIERNKLFDVLGFRLDRGEAIYVMLDVDPEPKMYSFPWSDEEADKLQKSSEDENSNGMRVSTFDKSLTDRSSGDESSDGSSGGVFEERASPRDVLPAKDGG